MSDVADLFGRRAAAARGRSTPRVVLGVPHVCLIVFAAVWAGLAIAPWSRATWALENVPTVIGVGTAVATFRRFRFSDRAYVQATAFLILHTIGSHYTYSLTPLGAWLQEAFGLSRNHYDRIVHFAYGVLFLSAVRELSFRRPASMPVRRQLFIAIALVVAGGTAYELVEWLTAIVADPAAGAAFLATQGDEWDAQKDIAVAATGALVGAMVEARVLSRGAEVIDIRSAHPPGKGRRR